MLRVIRARQGGKAGIEKHDLPVLIDNQEGLQEHGVIKRSEQAQIAVDSLFLPQDRVRTASLGRGVLRGRIFTHHCKILKNRYIVFVYLPISGIRNTMQAIRKTILPANVSISRFFRLATAKKSAHRIKRIHPVI